MIHSHQTSVCVWLWVFKSVLGKGWSLCSFVSATSDWLKTKNCCARVLGLKGHLTQTKNWTNKNRTIKTLRTLRWLQFYLDIFWNLIFVFHRTFCNICSVICTLNRLRVTEQTWDVLVVVILVVMMMIWLCFTLFTEPHIQLCRKLPAFTTIVVVQVGSHPHASIHLVSWLKKKRTFNPTPGKSYKQFHSLWNSSLRRSEGPVVNFSQASSVWWREKIHTYHTLVDISQNSVGIYFLKIHRFSVYINTETLEKVAP